MDDNFEELLVRLQRNEEPIIETEYQTVGVYLRRHAYTIAKALIRAQSRPNAAAKQCTCPRMKNKKLNPMATLSLRDKR